jgi:hypothetical protein
MNPDWMFENCQQNEHLSAAAYRRPALVGSGNGSTAFFDSRRIGRELFRRDELPLRREILDLLELEDRWFAFSDDCCLFSLFG